ncbi:FtsX-like permease family protein [Ornithinimicrobium pratense]|uniref:FtsX-like permease family protein n=1 Tax=Ornithinimicrobium pratense TaxID=2593973 RepID=A0A5J6V1M1_9MICO|nr:FtsX-like permease family protein [Ornithinimicrobium pratense]QFG67487.1 FtsX-like permease family protein [Ornithinimicrobium pratense]
MQAIVGAFAPAPVDVGRTVVTEPRPAELDGEPLAGRVVLLGGPDLALDGEGSRVRDLVAVVDGAWPSPAGRDVPEQGSGALHVGAAQAWGLTVGDVVVVEGQEVELSATWEPVDPQDPYWFGDDLARTGQVDDDHGPLIVDEALARDIGAPFVRWSVRPDAAEISPEDLSVLASGAESLRNALRDVDGVGVRGLTVEGDLAPTAATAASNLATARALGVVPLSVLVLVTGLAVVQLARLLTTTREGQVQLLVARGAARHQVLLTGLLESSAVAVLGAGLGAAAASGVMQLVPGGDLVAGTVLTVALVTLAGVLLVLAAVASLQAGRLAGGQAVGDRSGRARAATALATLVLVLAAAGVAWWQLDRAGSPLVRRPDGTLTTDLVAGAAPALLLAAAAVVAAALLGPLSRAVELATRRSRSAGSHLASAQVSRHLTVYAVPVVLTVLAIGATTMAALYAGTSAQLRDDLANVTEGAPLRADMTRPPATIEPGIMPPPPMDLTSLTEIDEATLVWLDENARVGDLVVPLTAADTRGLDAVANRLAGHRSLVPTGLDQLRSEDGGEMPVAGAIEVPEGVETLTVELAVDRELDPWGVAYLESLQASNEQFVEALTSADLSREDELDPREMTVQELEQTAASLSEPTGVEIRLLVRDTATGVASMVPGTPVVVPGLEMTLDEDELTDITVDSTSASDTVHFALRPGRGVTIEAIEVVLLGSQQSHFGMGAVDWYLQNEVRLRLEGGSQDLLADTAAAWGSRDAMTPDQAADDLAERAANLEEGPFLRQLVEVQDDGSWWTTFESNHVSVEPVLDTDGATWTLQSHHSMTEDPTEGTRLTIAPGAEYVRPPNLGGVVPGGGVSDTEEDAATSGPRVPVALTPDAAAAAGLTVGDTLELTMSGQRRPAVLTDLVPAVPGRAQPQAALVDSTALGTLLATTQASLPWPSQVWATPAVPAEDAVAVLREQPELRAVTGPDSVTVTDATSAARLVFWVASAGAVLLALTGIAAVVATLVSGRRPEVAVLRALGMEPGAQARSRAAELAGVVLVAVLLGLAAGWLVSALVVPELASSTTQPGRVQLPAVLRLEAGPWAVLLASGAVVLGLLSVVLTRRVRDQALDHEYREEVR